MEEQKRHSGFETMRILSMVMIVLMHGIGHGGLGSAAPQGTAAFWIYWLLFILARVSTNCFVMLSGYYLSERKGPVHAGRLIPAEKSQSEEKGVAAVFLHAHLLRCGQGGCGPAFGCCTAPGTFTPYLQRLLVRFGLFPDVSLGAGAERGGAKP